MSAPLMTDSDRVRIAEGRAQLLERQTHVPGLRRCPRCSFEKTFVAAGIGCTIAVEPTERADCPNCSTPLWRVPENVRRWELEREVERMFGELVERPDTPRLRVLLAAAFTWGYASQALPPEEVTRRQEKVQTWADGRNAAEEGVA